MNKVSIGIAFILIVFLGNAVSEVFTRDDETARYQGADSTLLADSGGNPWARSAPEQQRGRLPSYVTDPRYATKEDIETKLNHRNKQRKEREELVQQPMQQQMQQQVYPGYGGGMGLPQMPHIYTPYPATPYGFQPGYPGFGGMPGMGAPYMGGSTGYGGNPLITPYGNIYGNVVPHQETAPSSDD